MNSPTPRWLSRRHTSALTALCLATLLPSALAQTGTWPPTTAEGQTWIFSAAGETWTGTAGKIDSDGDREIQMNTPSGPHKGWLYVETDKTTWTLQMVDGDSYWHCQMQKGAGPVYSGQLFFRVKRGSPVEARGTCTGQVQVQGTRGTPGNLASSAWPYPLAAGQTWSVKMPGGTVTAKLEGPASQLSGTVSRTPPVVMGASADNDDVTFMIISRGSEQFCSIERAGASGTILTGTAYDMKSETSLGQCSATQGPASSLAGALGVVRPAWPVAPKDGDLWTLTTPGGTWKGTLKLGDGVWKGRATSGSVAGEIALRISTGSAVFALFADDGRVFGCRIEPLGTMTAARMSGDALYGKDSKSIEEGGTCTVVQER